MKRIICALLACLVLWGCTSMPVLREGYYLFSLEDSSGAPMYFCLESGGTGFVHTMGEDVQITWTPEGLGGDFSDGVITESGIEFHGEDGIVICTYSKNLPDEYLQPIFRPGFYIPVDGEYASMLCYAELREDGTGDLSVMGLDMPIKWEATKFYLSDLIACATEEGFVIGEGTPMEFTYIGDALPDGYLPDPPAPGTYCISSVGWNGDTTFYSSYSRDNGYLELREDNTGTLVFDGESYPFVLVGPEAVFDGWSMLLVDMSAQDTGGPAMVVGYTYDGVIKAESIAFRLLEGENENE